MGAHYDFISICFFQNYFNLPSDMGIGRRDRFIGMWILNGPSIILMFTQYQRDAWSSIYLTSKFCFCPWQSKIISRSEPRHKTDDTTRNVYNSCWGKYDVDAGRYVDDIRRSSRSEQIITLVVSSLVIWNHCHTCAGLLSDVVALLT